MLSQKVLLLARRGSSGAGWMLPSTSKARDVICSRGGSDVIRGGAGNDVVYARDGKLTSIDGGAGRDVAHVDRKDRTKNVELKLYR